MDHHIDEEIFRFYLPMEKRLRSFNKCREIIDALKENEHNQVCTPIQISAIHKNSSRVLICKNALVSKQYGVHHASGHPFHGTVLTRGKYGENNVTFPRGNPQKITSIAEHKQINTIKIAFYIQYLQFDNFGHLLTETISNIFPLIYWKKKQSDLFKIPIIINEKESQKQAKKLAHLLEIDPSQILTPDSAHQSFCVESLLTAAPSHVNRCFVSKNHAKWVKKFLQLQLRSRYFNNHSDRKIDKLYISRSKLSPTSRTFAQEAELENQLRNHGWEIYHPEEYTIQKQLIVYQSVKKICALEGSAIHLLFGANIKNIENFILLCRKDENNFAKQLRAQAINYKTISAFENAPWCTKSSTLRDIRLKPHITLNQLVDLIEAEN
tara:strand:- start:732 stop:1874 length:1143 start_codon:yes stop_codon:yes gene_type:complete